ncbi:distal tail protein Dit [Amphibacillus xylanus]|uniref:Putative phage tail protein n=1 Tax=Amphibacillus xylanus (strain ATCC 51415 / DSM 6626 / JCM 7361 / LMG 17667 / NBRC 15112 / Ep01) TaxID=698758 RepID=K0IVD0_AMPXN|nr:distal tail protein Dit [Amphibacillus xylanus]BAM46355.1 putative phage tail protein [Amphibacillus xylanus NBRC 15112]
MKFNGIKKSYLKTSRKKNRPPWMPIHRELVTVVGKPGAYLSNTQKQIRTINVPVLLLADDLSDLQKVKEDLANWLIHDEPKELIFNDEPDRVYYAVVSGSLDLDELVYSGQGIITFLCPDPFKYGHEKTIHFPSDQVIVENNGTAEADPIFELTATKKSTFAMISNGEDYNLIGQPSDVDVEQVDSEEILINERGETLSEWNTPPIKIDSHTAVIDGSMGTDGTGIVPLNYGSGDAWHGPARAIEINPIQDFEVEMKCRVELTRPSDTFRIETYLFDENLNVIGKIAIVDSTVNGSQVAAEGRSGDWVGNNVNYEISSKNYLRRTNHFHGVVKVTRKGKELIFYAARLGSGDNPIHHDTLTVSRFITDSNLLGRLKYIQIHFGKYGQSTNATVPRINQLKVTELKEVSVDKTPYIIYPNDVITFDHKNEDILVNGEPRKDLKNFGASFFTLKKGDNQLLVTPEDSFETNVRFRERFY